MSAEHAVRGRTAPARALRDRLRPARGVASVLVIATEPSGDRIAASILTALARRGVAAWGLGGAAARRAGLQPIADMPVAMGVGDVVARAPTIASAVVATMRCVRRTPPVAAVLVNASELSALLGRWIRRRGVPVLACVAPQIWAWRPGRAHGFGAAADRLAVLLPFEEPLWRAHGLDAHWVGHPSRIALPTRAEARRRVGLGEGIAVAILPGSRHGEITRLAPELLAAGARLLQDGHAESARVIAAPGLEAPARRALADAAARHAIAIVDGDADDGAAPLLPAFDLSLCASGTAALEAALAGAAPVVAYRLDALAAIAARLLLRTPHVALPNVLLARRAYPELLQGDARALRIADAARDLLAGSVASGEAQRLARRLRELLDGPPGAATFGERVVRLLDEWLVEPGSP